MGTFISISVLLICSCLHIISALVPGGCKIYQYQCRSGQCIDIYALCDGTPECSDGSDESNCKSNVNEASAERFRCKSDGRSKHFQNRCDGSGNCLDDSDEWSCPVSGQCLRNQYRCNNGACINGQVVCDGNLNCDDASDELFCKKFKDEYKNTAWSLSCLNGNDRPLMDRCDSHKDCEDFSDEADCKVSGNDCSRNKFRCNDGACRNYYEDRCDIRPDCATGEDELNCNAVVNCTGAFTCDNSLCVVMTARCDGHNDCGDASDEWNCSKINNVCKRSEFQCDNGRCVPLEARCDGFIHCVDASDEWACTDFAGFFPGSISSFQLHTMEANDNSKFVAPLVLALIAIVILLVIACVAMFFGGQHLNILKGRELNKQEVRMSAPSSTPPREIY